MFGRSFRIVTIGSIPVNVDASWIWIAVLAVYTLWSRLVDRFVFLGDGAALAYAVFGAVLFFGARSPGELPYFGPLQKVRDGVLAKHLVFSRLPGAPKEYVQDRMRSQASQVAKLIASPMTHIYICGLKGMETGVDAALAEIAAEQGLDWASLKPAMRMQGRYHVETY